MIPLIAIPDEHAIAADLIRQLQGFGWKGARQDVAEDHDTATDMIRSYIPHPDFFPCFLLFGGHMLRDSGEPCEPQGMLDHVRDTCVKLRDLGFEHREIAIECGNEADLAAKRWKRNPAELGKLYKEFVGIVKSFSSSWHCLSPSISNLDEDSLDYLDRMQLPIGAEVAFHRYPNGRDFWAAQRGFRTRGDEVARLKQIANGAPLWHTEGGFAQQERDYTLSEEEQATRIVDEIAYWRDVGVEAFTLYQLNSATVRPEDSDDEKRLATYGIRRADWQWKRAAFAVKEALG